MPGQRLGDGALAAGSRAINGDDEGRGGDHRLALAGRSQVGKWRAGRRAIDGAGAQTYALLTGS